MPYEQYQYLRIERRQRVMWIALTNPPQNAVNALLHSELANIFTEVDSDSAVDVVVLTGGGNAFSAGGDLGDMKERKADTRYHMRLLEEGGRIIHSLLALRKPTIARINGPAVGLGATLALFCDITIAVDDAKIGDPHVRVGLAAGDGGALIWPLLVGFARAREYLLTGKLLNAVEAAKIGLINYAVPAAELDGKVAEFVEWFAHGPSQAISLTKRAINQALQQHAATMLEAHLGLEARSIFSDEHDEAVAAFLEHRKPSFHPDNRELENEPS
jgi:enoyl-CoA hydratase